MGFSTFRKYRGWYVISEVANEEDTPPEGWDPRLLIKAANNEIREYYTNHPDPLVKVITWEEEQRSRRAASKKAPARATATSEDELEDEE